MLRYHALRTSRLLILVALTSGAITACDDDPLGMGGFATLNINMAGGTAALPDGSLIIVVPPTNYTGTQTYLVRPGSPLDADDKVVPGTIFQLVEEHGSSWVPSGTMITLRYDPARLPPGVTADGLQIYKREGTGWGPVVGSRSDPARAVVTGPFREAGTYGVRFTPVGRIALNGERVDGALYVGQSTALRAVVLSAPGDTLPGPTASWSTSQAGVATVDPQGTVTAVGAGTATISATIDGIVGTTQIQILARPVPSWTGSTDWTTFRGRNRRTGYVDATLDPTMFARRWEVALPTTHALNEPATDDGNVYVSTRSFSGGEEVLWALDATTGSTRWTQALGNMRAASGPATGNGRVYVSTSADLNSFLWSFDAADGTVRFRVPYASGLPHRLAPAVTSDIVFLSTGRFRGISAFNALNGSVLWGCVLPAGEEWTPAADAGKVYAFGGGDSIHGLLVLDGLAGTGTVRAPNLGLPASGTPILDGDHVFTMGRGRLLAIDLTRDVVAWSEPGNYQWMPAVDETSVYAVVSRQVEARSRSNGDLLWTWVPQPGLQATGSVIATRNLLFVQLEPSLFSKLSGRVVALDLTLGKMVWSYEADGEIALGNDLLLIASGSGAKVTAIAVR